MKMWAYLASVLNFESLFQSGSTKTFSWIQTLSKISFFIFGFCAVLTSFGINISSSIECDHGIAETNTAKSFVDNHCLINGVYTYHK